MNHRFALSRAMFVSDVGKSKDELWQARERKALVETLRMIEANIAADAEIRPSAVHIVLRVEDASEHPEPDLVKRWEVEFR